MDDFKYDHDDTKEATINVSGLDDNIYKFKSRN